MSITFWFWYVWCLVYMVSEFKVSSLIESTPVVKITASPYLYPFIFDKNYRLDCVVENAADVKVSKFSWTRSTKEKPFLMLNDSVDLQNILHNANVGVFSISNGSLFFSPAQSGDDDFYTCSVTLSNGIEISSLYFVPVYQPLAFLRRFDASNSFLRESFKENKSLLNANQHVELSCKSICSCTWHMQWYVDTKGGRQLIFEKSFLDFSTVNVSLLIVDGYYGLDIRAIGIHEKLSRKNHMFLNVSDSPVQISCIVEGKSSSYNSTALNREMQAIYVINVPSDSNDTSSSEATTPSNTVVATTTPEVLKNCTPIRLNRNSDFSQKCVKFLIFQNLDHRETEVSFDVLKPVAVSPPLSPVSPYYKKCANLASYLSCSSALCQEKYKICKEHCLIITTMICNTWLDYLPWLNIPSCNEFPSYRVEKECAKNLHIESFIKTFTNLPVAMNTVRTSYSCVSQHDYWRGMNYVDDGIKMQASCISWNNTTNPLLSSDYFESLSGAGSKCRNPAGIYSQPMCISKITRLPVICSNLPVCDERETGNAFANVFNEVSFILVVAFVVIVLVFVLLCAVILCSARRKIKDFMARGREHAANVEESISLYRSSQAVYETSTFKKEKNVMYNRATPLARKYPNLEKIAYPCEALAGHKLLGKGAFWDVYLCETTIAEDKRPPNMEKIIALKVLHENASEAVTTAFWEEADLLIDLRFTYILELVGICAGHRPFCLLVEYCAKGDLLTFLRKSDHSDDSAVQLLALESNNNNGYVNGMCNGHGPPPSQHAENALNAAAEKIYLINSDLFRMSYQIASAMIYLHGRGLVYRDLAARNILVTGNLDIRLSDFGMCRKLPPGANATYRGSESDSLPLRWLSPEALSQCLFSTRSDVYSFGVLLWEMFSFGAQPFGDLNIDELSEQKKLRPDLVLSRPDRASTSTYDVMLSCWNVDPNSRPSFAELYNYLKGEADRV